MTGGWTDAYTVDFSGSSGKGARPLVVSYASSPPVRGADGATPRRRPERCWTPASGRSSTPACWQGAKNPAGAQQVVDFLLSPEFQASVPDGDVRLPGGPGVAAARRPGSSTRRSPTNRPTLDPADIAANRDAWISAWSDLLEG